MRPTKETNEIERLYRCPACDELHTTKADAKNCCFDDTPVYRCEDCGEEFDDKKYAKDCCVVWYCGECDADHDDKESATKCCK